MKHNELIKKAPPATELEVFELLLAIYPERFKSNDNDTWDAVIDYIDDNFDEDAFYDLIGKIVMLAPAFKSPLNDHYYHVLGTYEDNGTMTALIRREVEI